MVKKQNLPTKVYNIFQAFLLVSWYYLLVSWYYAANTLLTFHLQKQIPTTRVPCGYTVQRRSVGSRGKGVIPI